MKSLLKMIFLSMCLAGIGSCTSGTGNTNTNVGTNTANTANVKTAEKPRAPKPNAAPKGASDNDERITFAKGASKKTVKVVIGVSKRFLINARAEQELSVFANSSKVSLNLEIGEAVVTQADDHNGFTAILKEDGDYAIEVVNEEDKPMEVTLTFEIQDLGE
jgi:hypothetical protein